MSRTHDRIVRLLDAGRTSLSEAEQVMKSEDPNWSSQRRLGDLLDELDRIIVMVEPDGSRYDAIVKNRS